MDMKAELLAQYARKQPQNFVTIDCWSSEPGADHGDLTADEDGHLILTGENTELMQGSHLRVSMPYGTNRNVAASLLRKLVALLDDDGESDLLNILEPGETLRRADQIAKIKQLARQEAMEANLPSVWP